MLAYQLELSGSSHIDLRRLAALDLAPGPWIGELKARLADASTNALITLPDGTQRPALELAALLVRQTQGTRIMYATDFADTAENHAGVQTMGAGADLLFCEATFKNAEREHALGTQHLTTRACGELAARLGVKRLVPFHFSKRYIGDLTSVYDEIATSAGDVPVTTARER